MRFARVLAGGTLFATLVLLSSGGLMSQEKKEGGKLKGQLPQGWSKLELSASQKEDIYRLNAEYKQKIEKLQEEIRTLQAELARKRVAVLTDEQKKKLVEFVSGESGKDKAKDKDTAKEKAKTDPDK